MEAVQYVKSVRRYLTARYLGARFNSIYTSGWGCVRLAVTKPPRLPSDQWVRVRPKLSGICGSDLATITAQGSTYFSPLTSTPFVLGHEVVGEVVECGAQVKDLTPGQRVVLEPPLHCRVREIEPPCPACESGHEPQCENIRTGVIAAGIQTGFCRDTGGGWSESLVAHRAQLHAISTSMPSDDAVLVEPFSCCLQVALCHLPPDTATVLVIGCGTMGLLTIAAVRALGSGCRLVAVARYPHQHEAARKLGADVTVQSGANRLQEMADLLGAQLFQTELGRPTALGGSDYTFDCVGSGTTIDDSLRLTRPRGKVVIVGMPAIPPGVDWTAMWHKELRIVGSYTAPPATFRQALRLIAEKKVNLEGIVGARYPLVRFRQAIQDALHTGKKGVVKITFEMD